MPVAVGGLIARAGLLCYRTETTPQFKDCESMLNLMLSLGYHDFKLN